MDVIIKSFNRPYYLDRCLCSIDRYLKGVHSIRVLDDGTPDKYLQEINKRHPNALVFKSELHPEKSKFLECYAHGSTPPDIFSTIPWDFWKEHIHDVSNEFLLMEDDQWFIKDIDLEFIFHLMRTNHCALIRLFHCPRFDCGALGKISPEIHTVSPWFLENVLKGWVFSAYLANRFKFRTILRKLGLARETWFLEAYALYVVSGIFNKSFWLHATHGAGAEINEQKQLINAVAWAMRNPKATFAATEMDYMMTTFCSSSSSGLLDITVGFDMSLFNRLLNEHWLAGQINPLEGMPGDFPDEVFLSVLKKANSPDCEAAKWFLWRQQFTEAFKKLGRA